MSFNPHYKATPDTLSEGQRSTGTVDSTGALRVNAIAVSSAQILTTTATILSGASLSSAIDLSAGRLSRIAIPASWTTANLTFQTSADNSTFNDLYDSYGTEYTVTVGGASRAIVIPLADFIGVRYLKIRSGTTGTPVNQGADRILTLVLVP